MGEQDLDIYPVIGEMLKTIRAEKEYSLEIVGKKVGVAGKTIQRYECAERKIKIDILKKMLHYYNIPYDQFVKDAKLKHLGISTDLQELNGKIINIINTLETPRKQKVYDFAKKQQLKQSLPKSEGDSFIPVTLINQAAAGNGYMYGDNDNKVVYANRLIKIYDFAIGAKGDSMEPEIQNGDALLCRKEFDFIDGDVYVVDSDGESYVKKVYDIGHQLRLASYNKKYKDIFLDKNDSLRIVGKVADWFTPVTLPDNM